MTPFHQLLRGNKFALTWLVFELLAVCGLTTAANAYEKKVRIYIRSFIPNEIPSIKDDLVTVGSHTFLKAPNVPLAGLKIGEFYGTCFSTDDRSFDAAPGKSARVTVDFVLKFTSRREFTVQQSPGNTDTKFVGLTRNVRCTTGFDLRTPERGSASRITIGEVKKNEFLRILHVGAAVGDPFYTLAGFNVAPDIDMAFVFTYNPLKLELDVKGTIGVFPAFEGYYSIDGEPKELFTAPPAEGATPWSLPDLLLGINSRNVRKTIDLRPYLLKE
jgi:hypothetical protein